MYTGVVSEVDTRDTSSSKSSLSSTCLLVPIKINFLLNNNIKPTSKIKMTTLKKIME